MKLIFTSFFLFFLGLNVFGQNAAADTKFLSNIKEIALAKDDGKGNAGAITEKFLTTDTPVHFIIRLNSFDRVTVKMNLIAVKAAGLKPETKSVDVSYTTDGKQNEVYFHAMPDGFWAAGNYRADIFLNGKLSESIKFDIEKSPTEPELKKPVAAKNFAPRKKPRKN